MRPPLSCKAPMTRFLIRRLAILLPTLLFVSIIIFGLQQLLPGDPAIAMAGEERDPQAIADIRGITLEEVTDFLYRNSLRAFHLEKDV